MPKKTNKNPCLKYNCSECCNPVKISRGFSLQKKDELKNLPFEERGEILAPESAYETTKLESFDCHNYDAETGLCKDYDNRPQICRDTECEAFSTLDEAKQREIIDQIKNEKFFVWKKK